MGLPIIPVRTQDQSYLDVAESIALEETAISHILNAEGEKVQAIASLMGLGEITPDQAMDVQKSVDEIIITTIKMQMLLQFKLDSILEVITKENIVIHKNIGTATVEFEGETYTASDPAYYYTEEATNI